MKKHEIENTIEGYFKHINSLSHSIIDAFEPADIQQFRKQVKKLKVLLHLMGIEPTGKIKPALTGKIITFYGYTGMVSNLQLQLSDLAYYFNTIGGQAPSKYTEKLEGDLELCKKNTREFMDFNMSFNEDQQEIFGRLPEKITKSAIKKFIQSRIRELQHLLFRLDDEKKLHTVRKLLEDILYNWVYVKSYMPFLSPGLSSLAEIKNHIRMLETYRDKCISLSLLHSNYSGLDDPEKTSLKPVMHSWEAEKSDLSKLICSRLEMITMLPTVNHKFSYARWFG